MEREKLMMQMTERQMVVRCLKVGDRGWPSLGAQIVPPSTESGEKAQCMVMGDHGSSLLISFISSAKQE